MDTGDVKDVSQSPAFQFVDDLIASGSITLEQADVLRSQYAQLHETVLQSMEREASVVKKVRQLNQELLQHKIEVEKLGIARVEEAQGLSAQDKEKQKMERALAAALERDTLIRLELSTAEGQMEELQDSLRQLDMENDAVVRPVLEKVADEIGELRTEATRLEAAMQAHSHQAHELKDRVIALQEGEEPLQENKRAAQQRLVDVRGKPDRVRRKIEIATRALEAVKAEAAKLDAAVAEVDGELAMQAKREKESETVRREVEQKQDADRMRQDERAREVDAIQKSIDQELFQASVHQAQSVQVQLELQEAERQKKAMQEDVSLQEREFTMLKRRLKKHQRMAQAAKEAIVPLEAARTDMRHQVAMLQTQNRQDEAQLAMLKQEVDVMVASYVRRESREKTQQDQLQEVVRERAQQEAQLMQWKAEERRMTQVVAALTAAREQKAREYARAEQNERETKEEVQLRHLTILDLTKRSTEIGNRLKEFFALYEVVKNERNKYVNLIQASSQAQAEMREKIKILQNEIEILRSEVSAKYSALGNEKLANATAQAQRDQLRTDLNKLYDKYRELQRQVEKQILEIDKLNSIINGLEVDMLKLKRMYEMAVEDRNFTGIQLIDRNDELCILYEKSNMQQQALRTGTLAMDERAEAVRMLNIQINELRRQIHLTRTQIPHMPEYAKQILEFQQELDQLRQVSEKLCRDLETPENLDRWRPLEGEDPTEDELAAKVMVLEDRLGERKEQLIEKQLVLEEVSALSKKLRRQAAADRQDTLSVAQRVNELQARVKEVTRKMMASVSELSMYQATALKLQQELRVREGEYQQARTRFEAGDAPSVDMEHDWERSQRDELVRQERALAKGAEAAGAPQFTRTTAEPRPNAYIPDDLGIPRPYGGHAPFRPTAPGTNMRHIRNPKVTEVQI